MHIAIVCYRYSIEVSPTVKNMATYFAEKGYSVSIFVDRLYRSADFSLPGVNLLIFDHCTEQEAAQKRDTEETRKAFSNFLKPRINKYDLLIGVEFTSLHLSVQAGADPGKFLYLSLEGIDLLRHSDNTYVGDLLAACRLLVVQSKERGDALISYLGRDLPFFYLPVSLRPVPVMTGTDKSTSLKLLYSGYFAPWACMEEFINSFQRSRAVDCCSLTLHGHAMGTKEYESLISQQIDLTPEASIDTRYFSDNEYSNYLGGFDVGLALYKDLTGTGNFENLIFSSGKIASYLWHGLAVITTIDHEMTRRPPFVRLLSWSPSSLDQCLRVIRDNLAQFKIEARKHAVRYFNFDTYMDSLLNTLFSKDSDSKSITIFSELLRKKIIHPGQPLRLHLGCGQKYLQGYINIDFPSENHTTQSKQIADYCANILELDFPPGSVDEIRCHHVLEHFERPVALSLLALWQSWLKKDGTLVIETPDLEESARLLLSEQATYKEKQVIIRHLFGSNEAHWAVHRDGWYGDRFAYTLSNLGFHLARLEKTEWNILRNISAYAIKNADLSREELLSRVDRLLRDGMVDTSDCEKAKHAIWVETASSNILRTTGTKEALASYPLRSVPAKQCACIIFSKDRAMQLDACLRSFSSNCIDIGSLDIKVIYTTSSLPHEDSYSKLCSSHSDVCFIREHSFKTDLTANLKGYRYILFVVDDCLFVRPFTIHQAIRSVDEQPEALGYSFRLGRNITYHYPGNSKQRPANIRESIENTLCVAWHREEQYFGYPLELSSSLYRAEDIYPFLLSLNYNNPNTLEAELAAHASNLSAQKPLLLFPELSTAFCNPLNIVQTTFSDNRVNSSNACSPETLLHYFNDGLRISIDDLSGFTPCSCHQDVAFRFCLGEASFGNRFKKMKVFLDEEMALSAGFDNSDATANGEWELLRSIVRDGDTLFDIGAHLGSWSEQAMKSGRISVHMFEAMKSTFTRLQSAFAQVPHTFLVNYAVADKESVSTFYEMGTEGDSVRMSSLIRRKGVEASFHIESSEQQIATISLDSYCEKNNVDFIDVAKIDVEGAECLVLQGAQQLLKDKRIGLLQFEYGGTFLDAGSTLQQACFILRRMGYTIFRIVPNGLLYIPQWNDRLENYRYSNYVAQATGMDSLNHRHRPPSSDSVGPCNAQEPFISIAIPAYNAERHLREALTSALNQNYERFEVLVVDDGSTDATRDIVSSFNDQRLKFIKKEHTGAPDTRNRCVSESRGEYILWLDSDDVLSPGVLNAYVENLHLFPDVDVMYGDIVRCDAKLTPIQAIRYEDWYKRNLELLQALFRENIIPNPGTLVRKQCLLNCGGYDPSYRRAHDYELWSRIATTARFKHVPRIAACWRMHDANLGAGRENVDTSYEARIVRKVVSTNEIKSIFPDLPWHSPVPNQAEAMACLLISKQLLQWKDIEGSISFVEKAYKFLPNDELRKHIENLKHFTGGRV